jgi:hypothetical protein
MAIRALGLALLAQSVVAADAEAHAREGDLAGASAGVPLLDAAFETPSALWREADREALAR